jgi:DNA repair protein RecO
MSPSDSIRLTAVPLARYEAGAGKRVVALFTREMGQARVFARHSGKKAKTFALSPYTTYAVLVRPAKASKDSKGIPELREHQVEKARPCLAGGKKLSAWVTASVLAELLIDTTEVGEPHPYLFDMLEEALDRLEEGVACADLLIAFILKFLEHTGYKPRLDTGNSQKKKFLFDVGSGGIGTSKKSSFEEEIVPPPKTRFMLGGETIVKLEKLRGARFSTLTETCFSAKEAQRLLEMLGAYVEYHFETNLKSLWVWREMAGE